MTVHTNCRANTEWLKLWELSGPEGRGERDENQSAYRVVGLVDAKDEDELWEEESGGSIVDYARLVALHGSQAEQEDRGEEEEAQRHTGCAPRQDFDGQDLSVLVRLEWENATLQWGATLILITWEA